MTDEQAREIIQHLKRNNELLEQLVVLLTPKAPHSDIELATRGAHRFLGHPLFPQTANAQQTWAVGQPTGTDIELRPE